MIPSPDWDFLDFWEATELLALLFFELDTDPSPSFLSSSIKYFSTRDGMVALDLEPTDILSLLERPFSSSTTADDLDLTDLLDFLEAREPPKSDTLSS
mmetsp:Transcript_47333/g.98213  ORF Transcript_47333/g.98213 Transcript_47333/m.98213 type:complete len:98 (-) Transcript_47333:297-590(-)